MPRETKSLEVRFTALERKVYEQGIRCTPLECNLYEMIVDLMHENIGLRKQLGKALSTREPEVFLCPPKPSEYHLTKNSNSSKTRKRRKLCQR